MEPSQNPENIPENANQGCPGTNAREAGKTSACQGCPNQKLCSSAQENPGVDPALKEIEMRMASVKHKILILSGKGGVGKSTVTTQLGFHLSRKGFDVGIMDIDLCGPSIPRMFGLQGNEVHQSNDGWQPVYVDDSLGVMSIGFLMNNQDDAVIWRGPRKNGLIKQFLTDVSWGELDYLLIDTPPGTSDEHISIAQYLKLSDKDGAIIVTTPQEVSLSDVRKEISFCRKTNINIIGVIENMSGFVCPHCKCESEIFAATTGGASKMCADHKIDLLGKIPLDPMVVKSCDGGEYIGDKCKDSKVVEAYEIITKGMIQKVGETNK